jgi:sec-independent protein translocase protein TatC
LACAKFSAKAEALVALIRALAALINRFEAVPSQPASAGMTWRGDFRAGCYRVENSGRIYMSQNEQEDPAPDRMSLLTHLEDLRKVIVVSVIAILLTSVASFVFVDRFLVIVLKPLTDLGITPIFTGVTEGLFFKFHVSLLAGLVAASPILLWQFWRFLVPALYPAERGYVARLVPISIVLFAAGVSFAYITVLRFMTFFLIRYAGEFRAMISVSSYLSFALGVVIPFGLLFEYPLLIYFLTSTGIIQAEMLVKYRKYAIVAVFIIAAILTPSPDPLTQIIVASPMLVLYETGIIVAKIVSRKRRVKVDELVGEQG